MAFTFAKATIQGRVGRDAEIFYTTGGKKAVSFSVVVGGDRKKDSDERWPAAWFEIKAWDDQALLAETVRRGAVVKVKGTLGVVEWDDRATGAKRSKLVVTAKNIEIVHNDPTARQRSVQQKPAAAEERVPW